MPNYYIWTIGCQMNKAESSAISDYLSALGYRQQTKPEDADLIVLNTCVVRQSAEDRVTGMLGYLKGTKEPRQKLVVTGCFVNSHPEHLKKEYPFVDLFFKPGDIVELKQWLKILGMDQVAADDLTAKTPPSATGPTAFVPIIQGCNNFCSYCIVPFRRGPERSRTPEEVIREVEEKVSRGVREVTLLGQNVDSYGHDLPVRTDLAELLQQLNRIEGLWRIRFLTNHPKDMSDRLIDAVASLDKVCEQINLPVQAGDNEILKAMRRGYTIEQYRDLVSRLRSRVPGIALSTDIIVGFPGETEEKFQQTLALLRDIRFDNVFCAMYSPRPGTLAARLYEDSIPYDVKETRHRILEELQAGIAAEINASLKGRVVEVLVEGRRSDKWYGRTRTNKLVFFESDADCCGRLVSIEITSTSPWYLMGRIVQSH